MRLSVVIPIYRAESLIEKSIPILLQQLNALNCEYEVLLCDDASPDNSRAVLTKIAGQYPSIKLFLNDRNYGLGHTLRSLFACARGEVIVYLDIDLPFGAGVVPQLLAALDQGCDIAVASRYSGGRHRVPLHRKIVSRLYYLCCKALFDMPVKDIGSGSIALRRKVIETLALKQERFIVHVEFFLKSSRRGFSIRELPIETSNQQPGSFRVLRHGPAVIADTVNLWWDLRQKN